MIGIKEMALNAALDLANIERFNMYDAKDVIEAAIAIETYLLSHKSPPKPELKTV